MKLVFFIISVLFFSFPNLSFAQTQTIKGKVIDKQSDYPLIGVNVLIINSNPVIGTTTDIDGRFRLEGVELGRHTIQLTYLGYEPVVLSNLLIGSAKELEVNVAMEESLTQLEEIVVKANSDKREVINQLATVSARTVSVEEAGRFAGSFSDPSRMAQNYAGVSGASDDRNDIIIRGNSPLGVLWRMEGINIPSPNHFATLGSTGGPVGMLNINNLSNSDFYTSAWTADYGNALSGVFDIKLRNGNKDKREYVGQIGFNGLELGAEGPFKKGGKSSYLINYRYSTLAVFKAIGFDLGTGSAIPQYQDVNFKLNMPTKNAGTFNVWGIGGVSFIEFENNEDEDDTNLFDDFENSKFFSKTAVLGASHTYFIDNNTYTKFTLVGSGVDSSGDIDTIDVATEKYHDYFNFSRYQYKLSAHAKFNRKINAKNTFSTGVVFDYYQLDMVDSINQVNDGWVKTFDVHGGTPLVQTYLNWQHRYAENLTFNMGLHDQYFALSKAHALEPRLGVKYDLNNRMSLNFGGGMHSMIQPILVYFQRNAEDIESNRNLDFSKAYHGVIGFDYLLTKQMRLKAEVYYQQLYAIPVDSFSSSFSYLNAGADFILPQRTGLVNEGEGTNYGVELTLERFFDKGFYFLSTASIFESKFKGSDKIEHNTLFNGNYVFNALAGKEFNIGKASTLSFDTKFTYAGGRRYTPIDLEASRFAGHEILQNENAFEGQYDPYFKWDFKISFKLNGKKVAQEWSADFTNLTNHQNIFQSKYGAKSEKIETSYQRGFFPNIMYRIYF